MTEQSNRAWMRGWGRHKLPPMIDPGCPALRSIVNQNDKLAWLSGSGLDPTSFTPVASQRTVDLDLWRLQREKVEAKRKARWRVFWNGVIDFALLFAVCAIAVGAFIGLLWLKDYFNI